MKRLTEIGIKTGTDKAHYHEFTEVYEDYFSSFIDNPRILEVGVANLGSISMYLEYFNTPYIVGIDSDDKSHFEDGRWIFKRADQSNILELNRCLEGEDFFDIIIDDGGHTMKQQQVTFGRLITHVRPGGIYILEDLHTSLRNEYIDSDCEYTSLEMLKLIKEGKKYFSNYIDREIQNSILSLIKNVEIFAKDPNNLSDSVTGILTIQ